MACILGEFKKNRNPKLLWKGVAWCTSSLYPTSGKWREGSSSLFLTHQGLVTNTPQRSKIFGNGKVQRNWEKRFKSHCVRSIW